jgi:hypothetical protein
VPVYSTGVPKKPEKLESCLAQKGQPTRQVTMLEEIEKALNFSRKKPRMMSEETGQRKKKG